MKLPALWILAAFAAGIGIAGRWPGPPKLWPVAAGEGNQFGHPVDGVVERYARAGVRFLRTDRHGAVTAVTDRRELVVRSFVEKHPQ